MAEGTEHSAAAEIDAKIASLADWRGPTLKRLRTLIHDAAAGIVEQVKWRVMERVGVPREDPHIELGVGVAEVRVGARRENDRVGGDQGERHEQGGDARQAQPILPRDHRPHVGNPEASRAADVFARKPLTYRKETIKKAALPSESAAAHAGRATHSATLTP